MDTTGDTGKAMTPDQASDHPFGPDAAAILPPNTGACSHLGP